MSLSLKIFISAPLENNVILLFDADTKDALLIDPSFSPGEILDYIQSKKLFVHDILITHGHFDHFAGLSYLLANINPVPKVNLHPADLKTWREGGGSVKFRIPMDFPSDPDRFLAQGQVITLRDVPIEVRHTPGHTPGSVIFYIKSLKTAIVGDLIFKQGVGRTDLENGNFADLAKSIESQIFSLPPDTILIPGHGPETSVAEELMYNPYVGPASKHG